jgi:hypothetical protein
LLTFLLSVVAAVVATQRPAAEARAVIWLLPMCIYLREPQQ